MQNSQFNCLTPTILSNIKRVLNLIRSTHTIAKRPFAVGLMPVVSLMPDMMEQYKDLWISGHATPGYPAGHNLTPGACVLCQRPDNSVVELTKLDLHNFTFEDHDAANLIGLELARLLVDSCYPELLREREEIEQKETTANPEIDLLTLIRTRELEHSGVGSSGSAPFR